jgi:hypothetical protein
VNTEHGHREIALGGEILRTVVDAPVAVTILLVTRSTREATLRTALRSTRRCSTMWMAAQPGSM